MAPIEVVPSEGTNAAEEVEPLKLTGWKPQETQGSPRLPASAPTTLAPLQKLTPRQNELAAVAEAGTLLAFTTDAAVKVENQLKVEGFEPTDGPQEGNIPGTKLIHAGSKWYWRPNIHIDFQIYSIPTPPLYCARVHYRDKQVQLPYLFFDKAKVDSEIDMSVVNEGPKLAPHEALKKALNGPRRTLELTEEDMEAHEKKKSAEREKRILEQAACVALNVIELKKNKDLGTVKVFIKGSAITKKTMEFTINESNKDVIEAIRLPKESFETPGNSTVAEFRRINKLFEKHMDKAKEARASAEDIHQTQADVVEMMRTSIRHTVPNSRSAPKTKFGKAIFRNMAKLETLETKSVLAAKALF